MLVIPVGLMGVGKTTTLKLYESRHRNVVRISRDDIRHQLYGENVDFSSNEQKEESFNLLLKETKEELSLGKTVLLDGVLFRRKENLDRVLELDLLEFQVVVVKFVCEDGIALKRIKEDSEHVAKDRYQKYFQCKNNFDEIQIPHCVINTSRKKPGDVYKEFVRCIQRKNTHVTEVQERD